MTCFEKLREIHPEWTDEKIRRFVEEECPDVAQIMNRPEWCDPFVNCEQCWEREVPSAEPPPPPMNPTSMTAALGRNSAPVLFAISRRAKDAVT